MSSPLDEESRNKKQETRNDQSLITRHAGEKPHPQIPRQRTWTMDYYSAVQEDNKDRKKLS